MDAWRNIPTKYKWDGDSLIDPRGVIADPPPVVKPNSSKITTTLAQVLPKPPVVTSSAIPVIPASKLEITQSPPSVNIDTKVEEVKAELTTEEKAAAVKMEEMLDKVLALLGQKAEAVEAQTNLSTGTPGAPLWDTQPLTLDPNKSAIYPAGRPINNPNHLMFMLWNGATICRDYTPKGWLVFLRRGDKQNPIPEKLFDALNQSGSIAEGGDGSFRIKER